jgi:hypothetical protein
LTDISIQYCNILIIIFTFTTNNKQNGTSFINRSLNRSRISRSSFRWPKAPRTRKHQRPKKVYLILILAVFIKKNKKITKFKIRRGKHLFTFKADKADMAKRLSDSLDTNHIEKVEIKKKRITKKAKK